MGLTLLLKRLVTLRKLRAFTLLSEVASKVYGGGKVCVLGLGDDPSPVVFKELIWKEGQIITSRVSDGEFAEVIEHMNAGNLKPDVLISKVMRGRDIQKAFELLEKEKEKYLKGKGKEYFSRLLKRIS